MKYTSYIALALILFITVCSGQTIRMPIRNGILQTDFDLDGFSLVNAGPLLLESSVTPVTNPANGKYFFYIKNDGILYLKDALGVEYSAGASTLTGLSDINFTSLADGDMSHYNTLSGDWINFPSASYGRSLLGTASSSALRTLAGLGTVATQNIATAVTNNAIPQIHAAAGTPDRAITGFNTTGKIFFATPTGSGAPVWQTSPTMLGLPKIGANSGSYSALEFYDSNGGSGDAYVALRAPNDVASSVTFILPGADGTNGQALVTNGSGQLSFATIGGVTLGANTFTDTQTLPSLVYSGNITTTSSSGYISTRGFLQVLDESGAANRVLIGKDYNGIAIYSAGELRFTPGDASLSADSFIGREAAALFQLGQDHATTPTAQRFKAHDVTTGTGADLELAGGNGSAANGRVVAIGEFKAKSVTVAHGTLTYAGSTTINFIADGYQTITLAGNITFTTSNLAAGRSKTIRIIGDGSTFTFPAGWKFLGSAAPASIANGKVGILTMTSFGTTDADVVAAYAVEP